MNDLSPSETTETTGVSSVQATSLDSTALQSDSKETHPSSINEIDPSISVGPTCVADSEHLMNSSAPPPTSQTPASEGISPVLLSTELPTANDNKAFGTKEAGDTLTDVSADDDSPENDGEPVSNTPTAVVSNSKKNRPPYKYDPEKVTLRFLFANRDGLAVTVECKPSDTVGEVKGALLSVWPEDMPMKTTELGGENLRLICMGKGYLMPDTRTLEDCQVPVFKTHPTPINVSVKPLTSTASDDDRNSRKNKKDNANSPAAAAGGGASNANNTRTGGASVAASQGCCVIL